MEKNINVKENACVVVIYDTVAGCYTAPITFNNSASAVRYFKTKITVNVEDYILYKVAEYNELTGDLIVIDRELLLKGVDLIGK